MRMKHRRKEGHPRVPGYQTLIPGLYMASFTYCEPYALPTHVSLNTHKYNKYVLHIWYAPRHVPGL